MIKNNPSGGRRDVRIPLVRPRTPNLEDLADRMRSALATGMLTNARYVRELEVAMADALGCSEAVAVSNCTTGLILTMSALDLRGEVIVPSFTFSATGHACFWSGLKPVFVDCDAGDWTISLSDAMNSVSGDTRAILGVHTFGNPADIRALEQLAHDRSLALIFDAAHAIGTRYRGRAVGGAGHASVFSLTPTKIITSGEGGVVTTNDPDLARELRVLRNYGDDGSYDCRRMGLNGRMSEFSAILGLSTLPLAEDEVTRRGELAFSYSRRLQTIPGVTTQCVLAENRSSYKDYSVLVDESEYGRTRDDLAARLAERGIPSRPYFSPPLHRQTAYAGRLFRRTGLETTERLSAGALTLPMHSGLTEADVETVCAAVAELHLPPAHRGRSSSTRQPVAIAP